MSTINALHPFRCALEGIKVALSTQRHLRIHGIVAGLVAPFGILLELSSLDLTLLLIAITLVIITELLNTAVELAVDLASPGVSPIARQAKDVAAGAVLIAALASTVVGAVVLAPPLLRTITSSPLSVRSVMLAATALGLVGSIVTALLPRSSNSESNQLSTIGNKLNAHR